MSRKYALVVTTSNGYLPGVNGMLNALWYYSNDVDFHCIYWDFPNARDFYDAFVEGIKNDAFLAPRFFPVELTALMNDGYPRLQSKSRKAWYLKFYRYLYAADRLKDYAAVAIFDADMQIVHNIMDYFDIAASTGRILASKNDSTGYEHDCVTTGYPFRSPALAPLSVPIFFDPKKFDELDIFNRLPAISMRYGISDMSSFNNALIETSEIGNVIVLPCALWSHINLCSVPLALRKVNDKRYVALNKTGDRLFSFHRKFWHESKCREHIIGKKGIARDIAYNNIRIFWEMTRFLNLECRHKIAWDPSWGGFPSDIEDIQPVSNMRFGRSPQGGVLLNGKE